MFACKDYLGAVFGICLLDCVAFTSWSQYVGAGLYQWLVWCGFICTLTKFILLYFFRAPLGGPGPTRNNVAGGSPLAKGMATTMHPGGGSLSSPATATRPALPLSTPQAQAQHQPASPPVGSCLRHSVQPVASQARSTVPTGMYQLSGALLLQKI